MQKIILTGDRPTGNLHLGHYVGSLKNRVQLQHTHKQYIMIADTQALTDNFENPSKVTASVCEVMADYISVGINPKISTIFIQSQIPELSELTIYYMNLVTLGRLQRNPTVKAEMQQKGYNDSIPIGFLCYPVSQAADITAFSADLVPVGEDQLPMIEQTNEIVRKFNSIYNTTCLKEVKPLIGNVGRLVGIDGKAKASKSLNNAIFLSDTPDEIKRKVFMMYTDPNHLKVSDPGAVDGNVVFDYLDAFHENREELSELKSHYRRGGLGDTTIKNILNTTLQNFLEPIREIRNNLKKEELMDQLFDGTKIARELVNNKMVEIKDIIGIRYKNI
jgi:tryptophanyl-tRNA synthetase